MRAFKRHQYNIVVLAELVDAARFVGRDGNEAENSGCLGEQELGVRAIERRSAVKNEVGLVAEFEAGMVVLSHDRLHRTVEVRAGREGTSFPSARYRDITATMATQDTVISKKRKGPAPTGKGLPVMVRFQPDQLAALDRWIDQQPEPKPTRPEAVRRLVAEGTNE